MKIMIASDFHIEESSFGEIDFIFEELIALKEKENIDELYLLGDIFDKIYPSPLEMDCFASFIKKIDLPTTIVIAKSHESESAVSSVLNHFGILKDNIKTYFEWIEVEPQTNYKMGLGHFCIKESLCGFNETRSIKDFVGLRLVVAGHQHVMQVVGDFFYHIGSVRYVNFDEVRDKCKYVGILTLSSSIRDFSLKPLKTPFPMVDIYFTVSTEKMQQWVSSKELEGKNKDNAESLAVLTKKIDRIPPHAKVRIVLGDFEAYKQWLTVTEHYRERFFKMKELKKFEIKLQNIQPEKKTAIHLEKDLEIFLQNHPAQESIKSILRGVVKK